MFISSSSPEINVHILFFTRNKCSYPLLHQKQIKQTLCKCEEEVTSISLYWTLNVEKIMPAYQVKCMDQMNTILRQERNFSENIPWDSAETVLAIANVLPNNGASPLSGFLSALGGVLCFYWSPKAENFVLAL
ncbi:hypothetical protein AVEN_264739-1 [Araneus ventricosus]|uniref:Uncharacterized protein n=1 Tax=Araneus ventricosus TaxID=182803 RepID=A0A4Y2PG61_ARAVE|nr:hypothetical protein AVEN_264739-1 [Araneus ventricosus]